MNSRRLVIVAILIAVAGGLAWFEPTGLVRGWLRGDAFANNRPASQWRTRLISTDPAEQERARHELLELGSESVGVLIQLMESSGDDWTAAEVRWRSAELIRDLGPDAEQAIPVMLAATSDPDSHVRNVAASALPAIGASAEQAVPLLIKMLNTENSIAASRALSEYGEDAGPAMDSLVDVLKDTSLETEVRWNAARTLGKMRVAAIDSLPVIVDHLKDEAPTVREHCAEAVGDIGPVARSAVPDLVAVLDDPATRVRRDAARSLGQIGVASESAVPALLKLLDDPESIVRDAARTALRLIDPGIE